MSRSSRNLKANILKLRKKGFTYKEISKTLNCSNSTVTYYLSSVYKKNRTQTRRNNRRKFKEQLVKEFGGKCARCGYDKSVRALHFHHKEPKKKEFSIGKSNFGEAKIRKEVKKCVLLCSNCHAEIEEAASSNSQET